MRNRIGVLSVSILAALAGLAVPASAQVRAGFNMTSYPSARVQGASSSGMEIAGGYSLGILEGDVGNGFGIDIAKDLGSSGKLFIAGSLSFLWYDGYSTQAYEGGLGFRFWQSGAASLAARALLGVEHCCGDGFSSNDFAFEPGAVFNYNLTEGLRLHVTYGIRMVAFEGDVDTEQVFLFGFGKRF